MEGVGCAGQQDAHVAGPLVTTERFVSISDAGVGVGARRRRRRREGGGIGGGSGGGRGSGGGAPTLLLALRVALLVRRRFRREVDALAAEIGTVRVSTPVELLAVAAAFTVGVTILSRSARAFASRRSKSATDRACPVPV